MPSPMQKERSMLSVDAEYAHNPFYAVTPPPTPEAQNSSNTQERVSVKVIDRGREKGKMQATTFVHPIVSEPIYLKNKGTPQTNMA